MILKVVLFILSIFTIIANGLQLRKVAAKVTAYFRQDKTLLVRKSYQVPKNQQFFLGAVSNCRKFRSPRHLPLIFPIYLHSCKPTFNMIFLEFQTQS